MGKIRQGCLLFCLSLVAVVTVPMVRGRGGAFVPAVMAQGVEARQAEADRFNKQGIQQAQTSQFREALQSFEKALQIYREIKDRQGEAASLGNLGLAYYSLGQYQKAIDYHQQNLAIARDIKDRQGEANSLVHLGATYYSLGQYQKAIDYQQQSLTIARKIKDRQGEAASLGNLGNAYRSLGLYQKAIEYYQQSLDIAREIKDRQSEANSLRNLALTYTFVGQYQKAMEYQQQYLTIAQENRIQQTLPAVEQSPVSSQQKEADRLFYRGVQQFQTSQFREALQSGEKALQIYRQIKDRMGEAASLNNLGNAYESLGQYQKAIEYHQQSLAIQREIGDYQGEANALGNLGIAYYSLGQYQKAIEYHQQSLAIQREIGDRQGEGASLGNLGLAYDSLGQYQKSIEYHQQSLAIAREIGDRQGEGASLGNLGNAYDSLGQYPKVIEYQQQSLAIQREIGDRQGEGASLGNLGNAYQSLGQDQKQIEYQQQRLAITREIGDREGEAASLNNLGLAYYSLGQAQKAIDYQQQSLAIQREIGDRQGEGASLGNLGIAYLSLGQYQKAIEYHQQSLAIKREIGDREGEAISLNNLGAAYSDNQQPLEAIKHLEASLTIYIEIRRGLSRDDRKQFLASNERTVITLAEVLIQQNQPEKAFEWLNLATTADLANYDRLINAKVKDPATQAALDNWNANQQKLEGMRQRLQNKHSDKLAVEYQQLAAQVKKEGETIGQKYPEVAELFETTTTDIAQMRQNIAPDTLVIQPVPLRDRDKVALFLVTREKLIVIPSDTKAVDFNQIVSQYRKQLADYQNPDTFVTGGKLYEILIRPIESQISASSPKNIAIIATGQLRYIPFETLYDEKTDQYLLQKYPIHYLTRISTAIAPATSRNNTLKIMAFANPKPTQKSLEGAEKEVDSISKTFPESEKYFGTEATLDIFKKRASLFPILHLATHGCFDPNGCADLAMQANTILFANSQQYPIAEAALLGLENTELITLSACQTAKEANAEGQEISGLAYVLERAGAKSVVASLWDAADGTTADIMIQFYQNLQKGMTKSEAMRQAKLSNINSHPFFWSPFILIGDAN